MRFRTTTYTLLFDGRIQKGIPTAAAARRQVRKLVAKGLRVICDRETQTPSTHAVERVFRNDQNYPLNTLRA